MLFNRDLVVWKDFFKYVFTYVKLCYQQVTSNKNKLSTGFSIIIYNLGTTQTAIWSQSRQNLYYGNNTIEKPTVLKNSK